MVANTNRCSYLALLTSFAFWLLCVAAAFAFPLVLDLKSGLLINILRYIVLPFFTVITALCFYFYNPQKLSLYQDERNTGRTFFLLILACLTITPLVSFALKYLKYKNQKYELFDAGIYLNKVNRIATSEFVDAFKIASFETHFHPILVFVGSLKNVFMFLPVSFIANTILLFGAAIPLYFLSKSKLQDPKIAALIAVTFVLNPLVHFNDILGFHPDSAVLPAAFLTFYFLNVKKLIYATLSFSLILMSGEQWIPFGVLLAVLFIKKNEAPLVGSSLAMVGTLFFVFLVVVVFPSGNSVLDFNTLTKYHFGSGLENTLEVVEEETTSTHSESLRKIFFFFFLVFPLAGLPLASRAFWLISAPELFKTLGSTELLHFSVESHYTLALIACLFIGYVDVLSKILQRSNRKRAQKIAACCLFFTMATLIMHSPLPTSVSFWSSVSNGTFNVKNYFEDANTKAKIKASYLLPNNPSSLQISNEAFFSNLSGTQTPINMFPTGEWREAEYIILHKKDRLFAGANSRAIEYMVEYQQAKNLLPYYFNLLNPDSIIQVWQKRRQAHRETK